MNSLTHGTLYVRRSIHIAAPPARVWEEFTTFERMNAWWGVLHGEPIAGTANGQRLVTYEPYTGGHVEMEVLWEGKPLRYGGKIKLFDVKRSLVFENDWIPSQGWLHPTTITLLLVPMLEGTLVELLHGGFENTGGDVGATHAAYEAGWGMTQLNALRAIVLGTDATPRS